MIKKIITMLIILVAIISYVIKAHIYTNEFCVVTSAGDDWIGLTDQMDNMWVYDLKENEHFNIDDVVHATTFDNITPAYPMDDIIIKVEKVKD